MESKQNIRVKPNAQAHSRSRQHRQNNLAGGAKQSNRRNFWQAGGANRNKDERAGMTYRDGEAGQGRCEELVPERLFLLRRREWECGRRSDGAGDKTTGRRVCVGREGLNRSRDGEERSKRSLLPAAALLALPSREAEAHLFRRVAPRGCPRLVLARCPGSRPLALARPRLVRFWDRLELLQMARPAPRNNLCRSAHRSTHFRVWHRRARLRAASLPEPITITVHKPTARQPLCGKTGSNFNSYSPRSLRVMIDEGTYSYKSV